MKKRIISYSLYGTDPKYIKGALANLQRVEKIYPGWTCRFYVSQEIHEDVIERLSEKAEVVRKLRSAPYDGTYWRFLAADDKEVDAVIVRDADSLVIRREALAVEEWLASDKNFHIIRDHIGHGFFIPGGLWGCRPGALPDVNMEFLITYWRKTHPEKSRYKCGDQDFLADVIYPLTKNSLFIHSVAHSFRGEEILPMPTPKNRIPFFNDSGMFSGNRQAYHYGAHTRLLRIKVSPLIPEFAKSIYRTARNFLPLP